MQTRSLTQHRPLNCPIQDCRICIEFHLQTLNIELQTRITSFSTFFQNQLVRNVHQAMKAKYPPGEFIEFIMIAELSWFKDLVQSFNARIPLRPKQKYTMYYSCSSMKKLIAACPPFKDKLTKNIKGGGLTYETILLCNEEKPIFFSYSPEKGEMAVSFLHLPREHLENPREEWILPKNLMKAKKNLHLQDKVNKEKRKKKNTTADDEIQFVVERICSHKYFPRSQCIKYEVIWEGGDRTWEKLECFCDKDEDGKVTDYNQHLVDYEKNRMTEKKIKRRGENEPEEQSQKKQRTE